MAQVCRTCNGSGVDPNNRKKVCPECWGTGTATDHKYRLVVVDLGHRPKVAAVSR